MLIIPSTYLPSISQIAHILVETEGVTIDVGEHYIKRSERNRTRIMTAQGVMELSIPIQKANRPRQAMRDVKIDNSKRWQHQHWVSILSAYKSSPFFDHYAPYIEPIYRREFESLIDFNDALLCVIFKLLRLTPSINRSTEYIDTSTSNVSNVSNVSNISNIDLRPKNASESGFVATPYIQVFEDRQPFVANLSILDLLFCEGPNAVDFLGVNRR